MQRKIICIGGANIDFKLKSLAPIVANTSNPINSQSFYGGVARNVAHNLANLTDNIHLQCVVGDDTFGIELLKDMQALGVNTGLSQIVKNQQTSKYHAILKADGELFLGLADMGIYDDLEHSFINSTWQSWGEDSLVFLDTNLPAELIHLVLEKAALLKLKVFIDPVSVEKSKKIPQCLEQVFFIKPDALEASTLTGMVLESIDDCLKAGLILHQRGAKNVVISLGKMGYVVVNELHQLYVRGEQVSAIVDVSGAGDAFIAGVLFGIQQGHDILKACQLGAGLAAKTIQSTDTVISA